MENTTPNVRPAKNEILEHVEVFVTNIVANDFSDRIVYHDLEHIRGVVQAVGEICEAESVDETLREHITIAAWFVHTGFDNAEQMEFDSRPELFDLVKQRSIHHAEKFLSNEGYIGTQNVVAILSHSGIGAEQKSYANKVLTDAIGSQLARKRGSAQVKKLYQQLLLLSDEGFSREDWLTQAGGYLKSHKFYTNYANEKYGPKKLALIEKLEKQKKQIAKNKQDSLKKELSIQEGELKSLQKKLLSVKGRDDKGIQTMFRTTSRNHYTLNTMVDRKANIMISVNAVILSLILGRIMGQDSPIAIQNFPILILLISCTISILFAIISIIPNQYQGEFTEEQIRNKEGNLLYYGNFHNMSFRDYQWGIMEMLNDGEYLYTTMIRDIYYLGQVLNRKSKMIRTSLLIFLVGFVLSATTFIALSCFHLGH